MFASLKWHLWNFLSSEKVVILPISLGGSFLLSVVLLIAAIPVLRFYNMVDIPSARRAHKVPTVRGGGIALVISYIVTLYLIAENFHEPKNINGIILGVSLISLISFIDDVKTIGVMVRLATHFLVSYICVREYLSPHLLFRGELLPFLDIILTIFGLVAFLNIYNFLDGIDGISAMQSIHLGLTCLILCIIRDKVIINIDLVFNSSVILVGISIAFLIFNWHPARVFLGDVGSIFIGLLHGLNLILIAASSERLFLAAAISSLYYIADGGITILLRIIRKEKFWLPHLNHFFQQAVRKGMSHKEIVSKISYCNFILLILAVASIYTPHLAIILSIITVTYILAHFHHGKS